MYSYKLKINFVFFSLHRESNKVKKCLNTLKNTLKEHLFLSTERKRHSLIDTVDSFACYSRKIPFWCIAFCTVLKIVMLSVVP